MAPWLSSLLAKHPCESPVFSVDASQPFNPANSFHRTINNVQTYDVIAEQELLFRSSENEHGGFYRSGMFEIRLQGVHLRCFRKIRLWCREWRCVVAWAVGRRLLVRQLRFAWHEHQDLSRSRLVLRTNPRACFDHSYSFSTIAGLPSSIVKARHVDHKDHIGGNAQQKETTQDLKPCLH
jgi:hypothetical protein